MSLNNIQLGNGHLVQLYEKVLVPTDNPVTDETVVAQPELPAAPPQPAPVSAPKQQPAPAVAPAPEPPLIRSLGGNAKKTLILVQREKEAFLPEGELKFLTAILSACGLSLADISLVNYHSLEVKSYAPLVEHFGSRQVLLFDVTPAQLGMPINFPPFQVQAFKETRYMQAPALHLVEADVTLKKNLWAALKNMFGI